jgi:hypothetical protein
MLVVMITFTSLSSASAGILLGSLFHHDDGGDVPPKRWVTFNGLEGVIFHKLEFFKTIAVRTLTPARNSMFDTK